MATHSSVLSWRIPEMAEPGGLLSMGSHRVRHDWSDLAAAEAEIKVLYTNRLKWMKRRKLSYTKVKQEQWLVDFKTKVLRLPWWLSGKEFAYQCRRHRFNPWSGNIPYVPQLLKPVHHRAATREVNGMRSHAPQLVSGSCLPQLEKTLHSKEDPAQPKNKSFFKRNKVLYSHEYN